MTWLLANWRLVALAALVAAAFFWARHELAEADAGGYARAQSEYEARAELQRETNRGRARQAEEQQAVRTVYRTRYITRAITELDHAAADLSRCPVPAAAVQLLNDAAKCAREDRPAACGAGDAVRDAGRPSADGDGQRPRDVGDAVD